MNDNILMKNEYLITNGIGGFASSTVSGANTRKYHALLNAALNPPVNRNVLLSKIETQLIIGQRQYTLESVHYKDQVSDNSDWLVAYANMPLPTFDYLVEGITIKKELAMQFGENTTAVNYTVSTGHTPVTLRTYLHVNCRDHHDLSTINDFKYDIKKSGTALELSSDTNIQFFIKGFGAYHEMNTWAKKEFYPIEASRGQADEDVNFITGYFEVEMPANTCVSFDLVASTQPITVSGQKIISGEIQRRAALTSHESDSVLKALNIACDHFIVDRQSTQSKTVIAGYPWFTDWGRDTMIALPGLTLSTNRFEDAKNIIGTFIKYVNHGLIPNMFPDDNVEPMYNTIDGTLWLFIALHHYHKATKDEAFIKEIFPVLEEIISQHIEGTKYHIKVDTDGLLTGGDETTQLTWMDVKIDGYVVTPRHGKAVEINALWFNALKIMADLSKTLNLNSQINYDHYADLCHTSFNEYFWDEANNCLYDLIQNGKPVNRIRPNQIFAVSLPFKLLSTNKAKLVLKKVEAELLTPFGLRSLSRDHRDYKPSYGGDVYKRDYAYHQGTVWGWLIGPYLEAHYKVHNDKKYVADKVSALIKHLGDTGLGTISEVFSGDQPHEARGCFAQAWSVSELLRVYKLIE